MAVNMQRIYGTNNAFEYSETVSSAATTQYSQEIFIPSNVASLTMGLKRSGTSGTAKYKVQVTYSTKEEVANATGVWFDWDITGVDSNGYIDEDAVQWWIPVPSHIRLNVENAGTGTDVYFSMRAN